MKEVKSTLIFKKIFVYIDEERKLKLAKYNKSIQDKLNIKLINYKLFNGKYIIYETKLKGKEYYGENDAMMFEGEFKNGEKNGKGKEYNNGGNLYKFKIIEKMKFKGIKLKKEYIKEKIDNNILTFEGEYLKGKRNGKGKEFDSEGNLVFEGEYLNGEKNGKGKEYDYNGNLIFEGEYLKGFKNGIWK